MKPAARLVVYTVSILSLSLAPAAAPLQAQNANCPQCRTFEDGKKRVEATLQQIETELELTQQHLEQLRKTRARKQAEATAKAPEGSETTSILDDMMTEDEQHDVDRIDRLNRAKKWYEEERNRLDKALDHCANQGCPGGPGAGKPAVGLGGGIDIWHLSSPCPHCEDLQGQIEELEDLIWGRNDLLPRMPLYLNHEPPKPVPHATGEKIKQEMWSQVQKWSDNEEKRASIVRQQQKLVNQISDPTTSGSDRLKATQELKQNNERIKQIDQTIDDVYDKMDLLDELDGLRQQNKGCQQKRCAPQEPQTSIRPGLQFYFGISGSTMSWEHPKTAVDETLNSIDAPPGSTKSSATDTSTNTAAVEVGLQIPLKSTRRSVWGLEGGVTLANGTEFTGTATVEAMGTGGTALNAKVYYQFDTGKPVAVDLTGYVRGENGFFFRVGPSYLNVPMTLKTTEIFLVDGMLTDESVSKDSIHDSALGFKVGLGWSWKHFEVGADYRQAKINEADMKSVQAGLRIRFGHGL